MSAQQRFADALAAEYAAIYGYGALGPYLPPALAGQAQQAELAHRARRDAILVQPAGGSTSATPGRSSGSGEATATPAAGAGAGYVLPFPVRDTASALRLAVTLEERTAAIWRQALPDTTGEARRTALDALVDCALRAARWRRAAGTTPGVVPFTGTPV